MLRSGARLLLAALCLLLQPALHAQGCSMCRDTTAGSAPQVRAALRKAIPILALPAAGIFLGVLALARRFDAGEKDS